VFYRQIRSFEVPDDRANATLSPQATGAPVATGHAAVTSPLRARLLRGR
jgi:hypothetical protein